MLQIFAIFILIFIIFYQCIRKEYKSPLFVFAVVWCSVLVLYNLKLFQIYDVNSNTSVVLFGGICAYCTGYIICEKLSVWNVEIKSRYINYNRLNIGIVLLILSSLFFYVPRIIAVLQGGSASINKLLLVTGEIDSGGVWMQYIVRPFEYIIIAISAYCFFNKKSAKILVWSGAIVTIIKFIGTGSKAIIIYYIICLGITYFSSKSKVTLKQMSQEKLKYRKVSFVLVGLIPIIFLLDYMNIFTTGIKSMYFYISGCVPMLDKVLNDDFYLTNGYTWGFVSFNSIARLLIKTLSVFGIDIDTRYFDIANAYIEKFEYPTEIAPGVGYNAFVTIFSDFYADYGYVGVVLLSLGFGIFSCRIYNKWVCQNSLQSHVIYCILMYYIIFSVIRFQISNTVLGLTLVYSCTILDFLIRVKFKSKIKIV